MIKRFEYLDEANTWITEHPEWKAISVSAGHMAGSILVVFEAVKVELSIETMHEMSEMSDSDLRHNPGLIPRRRGRPPKVRDASIS